MNWLSYSVVSSALTTFLLALFIAPWAKSNQCGFMPCLKGSIAGSAFFTNRRVLRGQSRKLS
jgi:hypothetical protein